MTFSLTAEEQNRVKLAALLGHKLDPIGHKDMALIIAISAVYGISLVAVIFMLWNKKYPPLKSKSPILMAFAYISCVFWFVGDLQINGHVHLYGTIMTDCRGVGVWMRVLLGVCTVSALIALRSYGLYRVFKKNRPYRGLGLYIPIFVYCGCTLVFGIVTQVLPKSVIIEYQPMLDVCYCPKPFRAALYGYIWATWVVIAALNWAIRSIKTSFNESHEMAISCIIVFAILTFSTVLVFVNPEYPLNQTLRLLATGMDHLGTNLVWWTIMGVPLFNCAFNRNKYLEYWAEKLRKDGLQHQYDIKSEYSGNCSQLSLESGFNDLFFPFDNAPEHIVYLPNGELRPHSRKKRQSAQTANPCDPFDIPSLSPTTVNPPAFNDPFLYYIPRTVMPAVANDSLTVLPRFSPATSHSSISPVYTRK
ncbi:hypothetical protein IW148_003619 [Coemansia sp. RSA 1199]|nr:hypothetical protein IW148_003619 [Coemansia sp. RSA 1199]